MRARCKRTLLSLSLEQCRGIAGKSQCTPRIVVSGQTEHGVSLLLSAKPIAAILLRGENRLASAKSTDLHLGFMTAIEVPDRGHAAGLLITNRFSRPLEFQCTTPVKPNRTQELLYGPTLFPFLLGELLACPLVEKVGVKPDVIITDRLEMLQLRDHTAIPVACVAGNEDSSPVAAAPTNGPEARESDDPSRIRFGTQLFRIHPAHVQDRTTLAGWEETLLQQADLTEPLTRVREALKEAVSGIAGAAR